MRFTKSLTISLLLTCFQFYSQVEEKDGFVSMEMESTTSPLGLWQKITNGAPTFISSASGGVHLEFTGNAPSGGGAKSPLEYKFRVNTTGTYSIIIQASKRLEGEAGDKCNDCFIKMAGDFTSPFTAIGEPDTEALKMNNKFFNGGVHPKWDWSYSMEYHTDISKKLLKPLYNFKAGETYTLTISGRSQRYNPDFITIYNTDVMPYAQAILQSPGTPLVHLPVDITCPWSKLYFDKWDLTRPSDYLATAAIDEKGFSIEVRVNDKSKDQWAAAKQTFTQPSGLYSIKFTTVLEKAGESFYRIFIDGKLLVDFQNPKSNTKSDYVVGIKDIYINQGAIIQVDCKSNTNNSVINQHTKLVEYASGIWKNLLIGPCENTVAKVWLNNLSLNSNSFVGEIRIFPNPFSDQITIENVSSSSVIKVYNLIGKEISVKSEFLDNGNAIIKLPSVSPGIYFVKINTNTFKVIKI